jgi:hypothetical protein
MQPHIETSRLKCSDAQTVMLTSLMLKNVMLHEFIICLELPAIIQSYLCQQLTYGTKAAKFSQLVNYGRIKGGDGPRHVMGTLPRRLSHRHDIQPLL